MPPTAKPSLTTGNNRFTVSLPRGHWSATYDICVYPGHAREITLFGEQYCAMSAEELDALIEALTLAKKALTEAEHA